MLSREQFLKEPPEKCISPSTPTDVDNNNVQRTNNNLPAVSDDASNWTTDDEEVRPSSRRRRRHPSITTQEQIDLSIMRMIFDAQTDEVKRVIMSLHQMQLNQKKANCELFIKLQQSKTTAPRPFFTKKRNKTKQLNPKKKRTKRPSAIRLSGATLQNNRKILARVQRRRHTRRKPESKQNKRKKFPRRKHRRNAKSGNRQYRKRICRSEKLFNNGFIFLTRQKLMEKMWKSTKDPNENSIHFYNKNTYHGLSKLHLRQMAVYEQIEEDLQRLSITREERTKAAEERKAKELLRAELRQDLKNKIMAKAAAHAENDALRQERRAVRKKRALDKKMRQQTAKAEIRLYCKSVV